MDIALHDLYAHLQILDLWFAYLIEEKGRNVHQL